ncbi:MAG: hypothetical protein AB7K52_12000 [Phycisphaerales bacterium]
MAEAIPNNDEGSLTGELALAEAVSRNSPVEIVRLDGADDAPPGRGRLLEIREHELVLEKVQVIGREVAFGGGSIVECYFSYKGQLFQFRSEIKETGVPFRLNDQFMVPGMTLARPKQVVAGQRRRVFRVSLGSLSEPPVVQIWSMRTTERGFNKALAAYTEAEQLLQQQMKANPKAKFMALPVRPTLIDGIDMEPPDYEGTASEASDTGLGVVIEQCTYTRFKVFEPIALRIHLGETQPAIPFFAEVRHTREIRQQTTRLGIRLVEDSRSPQEFQRNRRKFVLFLQDAQRSQRR